MVLRVYLEPGEEAGPATQPVLVFAIRQVDASVLFKQGQSAAASCSSKSAPGAPKDMVATLESLKLQTSGAKLTGSIQVSH